MAMFFNAVLRSHHFSVIGRDVKVEVTEISRAGCLLVTTSAMPVGTVATLNVELDGGFYSEDVRVARCLRLHGAGERHHVGVEFLSLRQFGRQSLRLYAAGLEDQTLAPRCSGSAEVKGLST